MPRTAPIVAYLRPVFITLLTSNAPLWASPPDRATGPRPLGATGRARCRSATGRTFWTGAEAPEVFPGVDAGRVPVFPDDIHRVVPDRAEVDELLLVRGELGETGEHARRAALAATDGAGTGPAEVFEAERADVPVLPGDVDRALFQRRRDHVRKPLLGREIRRHRRLLEDASQRLVEGLGRRDADHLVLAIAQVEVQLRRVLDRRQRVGRV